MACPNSNLFEKDPAFRQSLYYGACLPIRLIVLFYMWAYEVPSAAAAKFASLVFLFFTDHRRRIQSRQWWSHGFVVGIASLIVLVPTHLVKWVFAASILGGIAQASNTTFC